MSQDTYTLTSEQLSDIVAVAVGKALSQAGVQQAINTLDAEEQAQDAQVAGALPAHDPEAGTCEAWATSKKRRCQNDGTEIAHGMWLCRTHAKLTSVEKAPDIDVQAPTPEPTPDRDVPVGTLDDQRMTASSIDQRKYLKLKVGATATISAWGDQSGFTAKQLRAWAKAHLGLTLTAAEGFEALFTERGCQFRIIAKRGKGGRKIQRLA